SFASLRRPPPASALFPYTTLFRSRSLPVARYDHRCGYTGLREPLCVGQQPVPVAAVCAAREQNDVGRELLDPLRVRRRQLVRQRSEEHTSELQSRENLVCRLLLEK